LLLKVTDKGWRYIDAKYFGEPPATCRGCVIQFERYLLLLLLLDAQYVQTHSLSHLY